jgi:mannose-1-phosphate guanylyltransferase
MKAIVFAGGVGTRFWPISRKNTPKQFESVIGDKSMLQLAVDKLFPDFEWSDIFISTGKQYENLVKKQLPKLPKENIIIEPDMRDVGPAVGLAIGLLTKISPDEPVVILWSDHLVKKEAVFRRALKAGEVIIKKDPEKIVFLGQTPRFPSQNLGYISFGKLTHQAGNIPVFEFKGFKYRPSLEVAKEYFSDGQHSWNPGYFITNPSFLFNLYQKLAPNLYKDLKTILDSYGTKDYQDVLEKIYPKIEKIHFDNAILEKMDPKVGLVLSEDIGWSDIGAWEQLKEALSNSEDDNVTKGKVIVKDSRDSLVFNYTKQMVVGIDLDEMLVINTEDVILVCPKNSVPKIKKFVEELSAGPNSDLT